MIEAQDPPAIPQHPPGNHPGMLRRTFLVRMIQIIPALMGLSLIFPYSVMSVHPRSLHGLMFGRRSARWRTCQPASPGSLNIPARARTDGE